MGKASSYETAAVNARDKLRGVDMDERFRSLGIDAEKAEDIYRFHAFGRTVILRRDGLLPESIDAPPLSAAEIVLVLHYLAHPMPVRPTGELIGFRDLPGGMFYYDPFVSRAVTPLVKTIGNDIDRLRRGLSVFHWEPYRAADFGAAITIIGPVSLYLLYWAGDDEFGPRGEYLFDRALLRVFGSEDMAVMTSCVTATIAASCRRGTG